MTTTPETCELTFNELQLKTQANVSAAGTVFLQIAAIRSFLLSNGYVYNM